MNNVRPLSLLRVTFVVLLTLAMSRGLSAQVTKSAVFTPDFQWHCIRSSVRLKMDLGNRVGYCTGVVVGTERNGFYVASAPHCFDNDIDEIVVEAFGKKYPSVSNRYKGARILATDTDSEFALLFVPGRFDGEGMSLCPPGRKPKQGDKVLSVGCGNGSPPTCEVDQLLGHDPEHWAVAQNAAQGRSGGPLISEDGYVIGCCCCGNDKVTFYSFLKRMHDVLDDIGLGHLYVGGRAAATTTAVKSPRRPRKPSKQPVRSKCPTGGPSSVCNRPDPQSSGSTGSNHSRTVIQIDPGSDPRPITIVIEGTDVYVNGNRVH